MAACGLVLVGLAVAAVIVTTGGDEPVPAPEPRVAFAQASHRLTSAGVFAYHGSAQAEAAGPVRPAPWLAAEVAVEGEVKLPARTHEVVVDAAGRAAETVTVGPTAWGRLAAERDELSQQPLAVVSEGPPVMGAALLAEWLGATTVRRQDGTDDHGRPAYTATFETAPTEARPNRPRVEGDVRLVLDAQGDPAGVDVDGIANGARFRMQLALSDIGGDIRIPTPGGRELGVTGPVTRDEAIAAGISHPVQLGRVPEGWVLMRMLMEAGQPRPGCSILRLEYRDVDGHESTNNAYFNDDTIALLVTSQACSPESDLPNWHLDEPFATGRFSGFVSTSNSFDSMDGLLSDGNTSVKFSTDLDVEAARSILESLSPFDPAVQPTPVDLSQAGRDDEGEQTTTTADRETQRYIDAVADEFRYRGDLPIDDKTAACVARAMVNVVGVDTLADAGISPDEFADAHSLSELDVEAPADAATRLGEAFGECDFAVLMTSAMAEGFEESAGTELPAVAITCLVRNNMRGHDLTDALAAFFLDGSQEDFRTVIGDALVACPEVSTAILLGQSPADETPETEACVLDFVTDNPDLTIAFFERDAAALGQIGTELRAACPALGG